MMGNSILSKWFQEHTDMVTLSPSPFFNIVFLLILYTIE